MKEALRTEKVKGKRVSLFSVRGGYIITVSGKTVYDTRKLPLWENTYESAQDFFLLTIKDVKKWGVA